MSTTRVAQRLTGRRSTLLRRQGAAAVAQMPGLRMAGYKNLKCSM